MDMLIVNLSPYYVPMSHLPHPFTRNQVPTNQKYYQIVHLMDRSELGFTAAMYPLSIRIYNRSCGAMWKIIQYPHFPSSPPYSPSPPYPNRDLPPTVLPTVRTPYRTPYRTPLPYLFLQSMSIDCKEQILRPHTKQLVRIVTWQVSIRYRILKLL